MKKLLLSSIVLFLFSASILMFQVSCQKEANARIGNITQANKIVYVYAKGSGEIWMSEIDGTNNHKVNITLPANESIVDGLSVLPDGSKLIFSVGNNVTNESFMYTCNPDGSNLTKIITATGDGFYSVNAY